MNGYQPLALSFAEELSDLKRRYEKLERKHADLERHCRGLESKLSKTRDRMKMYRERCKAWERALATVDRFHWCFMRDEKPASSDMAYAVAACAALIRKEVAPTYPSVDCAELHRKILNRAPSPEVDKTE